MITETFKNWCINVPSESVVLRGITEYGHATGTRDVPIHSDGSVDPHFYAVFEQDPTVNLTTLDLRGALDLCGIGGLKVLTNPLEMFFAKLDDLGGVASGSVHLKMSAAKCLMLIEQISASQGGPATIRMATHPRWDGTTTPLAWASNVALPAGAPNNYVYTVGPVWINGTKFSGVQSVQIDFGVELHKLFADGERYASAVHLKQRSPSIRINGLNASAMATLGLGVSQGATASQIWLQRIDPATGHLYAGTAEQHVCIQVSAGRIRTDSSRVSQGAIGAVDVMITPGWDGTHDVLDVVLDEAFAT